MRRLFAAATPVGRLLRCGAAQSQNVPRQQFKVVGTVPLFMTMLIMTVTLISFQELALWLPRWAFGQVRARSAKLAS